MAPRRLARGHRLLAMIASCASAGACVPQVELTLPDAPGAHTLVVFSLFGEDVEAHPFDLDDGTRPPALALSSRRRKEERVFAVFFAETIAELQLEPATYRPPEQPTWTRLFPRPLAAHEAALEPTLPAWTASSTLPPAVDRFPLPPLDEELCFGGGGCLASDDEVMDRQGSLQRQTCSLPCPELPALTGVTPPMPPIPPELPSFVPCPLGWATVPEPVLGRDGMRCQPSPITRPLSCGTLEVQAYGAATCASIGPQCPEGQWPEDLPAGTSVRYVLASATPGGDGSATSPFTTIGDALVSASAGTVVVVGRGTYRQHLIVPAGVSIVGACVAETELAAPSGGTAIDLLAGEVLVRGLHVGASTNGVTALNPGTHAVLEDLLIDGDGEAGIHVGLGATLEAKRVVVRDRRSWGVLVTDASGATLEDGVIERTQGNAVASLQAAGSVALRRVAIRDISAAAGGVDATGLDLSGAVDLEEVSIDGVASYGVHLGPSATASMRELHVRDVGVDTNGYGVVVDGGRLVLSSASIAGSLSFALLVQHPTATATISDLVVRGDGRAGRGIEVFDGAHAWFTHLDVRDVAESGLRVYDPGTSLAVSHLIVSGVSPVPGDDGMALSVAGGGASLAADHAWIGGLVLGVLVDGGDLTLLDATFDGLGSSAIYGTEGSTLSLARTSIARATAAAILLLSLTRPTRVELQDLAVRDTRPSASNGQGIGVAFGVGPRLTLLGRRLAVAGSIGYGVYLQALKSVALDDLDISETALEPSSGVGEGLFLADIEAVALQRARVRASARTALYSQAANLSFSDLAIDGASLDGVSADARGTVSITRALVAGTDGCALTFRDSVTSVLEEVAVRSSKAAKAALCLKDETRAVLRSFALDGEAKSGVLIEAGKHELGGLTTLELHRGLIRGHPVGAELLDPLVDVTFDQVRFVDNGVSVERAAR